MTRINARTTAPEANLTSSEIAEFKGRLTKCWAPPEDATGMQGLSLSIRILLDRAGGLRSKPELIRASASRSGLVLAEIAMRALQFCQPYDFLPAAKYEHWRTLVLTFAPDGLSDVSPVSTDKGFVIP
jgi:hypothetical protein